MKNLRKINDFRSLSKKKCAGAAGNEKPLKMTKHDGPKIMFFGENTHFLPGKKKCAPPITQGFGAYPKPPFRSIPDP